LRFLFLLPSGKKEPKNKKQKNKNKEKVDGVTDVNAFYQAEGTKKCCPAVNYYHC